MDFEVAETDSLKPGDVAWIRHENDVETIPKNAFNTKRCEPVRIVTGPGKKEKRFYVESLWRTDLYFFVSPERFMTKEQYDAMTGGNVNA